MNTHTLKQDVDTIGNGVFAKGTEVVLINFDSGICLVHCNGQQFYVDIDKLAEK